MWSFFLAPFGLCSVCDGIVLTHSSSAGSTFCDNGEFPLYVFGSDKYKKMKERVSRVVSERRAISHPLPPRWLGNRSMGKCGTADSITAVLLMIVSNDGGFCGGSSEMAVHVCVYIQYAATALVVVFFLKVPELVWWPPFLNAGFS